MLLEKAFAKVAGSYAALKGGASSRAWLAMTGCTDISYYDFDDFAGQWIEGKLDTGAAAVPFTNWSRKLLRPGQPGFKGERKLNHEQMFAELRAADERNHVMGASIGGLGGESKRPDGLVEGHAYSLIACEEVPLKGGGSVRLVELRNPWGNQQEWSGAWSDASAEWKKHPEVKKALKLQPRADGLFWMGWDDFCAIFTSVELCRSDMPTRRAGFDEPDEAGGASRHSVKPDDEYIKAAGR
eukprot:6181297-Prymnesium_polylepis.1